MDIRSILTAVMWLAILGLVVLIGARVVGGTASRAASAV